jgi:phage-related protein
MANKSAIMSLRIIGDAKKAIIEMDKLGNHTSKFGSLVKSAGAVAVAGLAAASAAIGGVVIAGVKAAGDLEQSVGALDTVFGDAAASMHKNAQAASDALGLTENSYNELATLLGTQLKNGMGGAAADMQKVGAKTNELIGLGADLASMFGGTTSDAVGALSSALKGERDPIERYGVSLKQAAIDAKAAELGFTKVGGSFDAEAQQAATLALIMEQTSAAHGNFARESDTFAHQIEVGKAQIGNITAEIGKGFLPILTKAGQVINTKFLPGAQKLASQIAPTLAVVFSTLGPMINPLIQGFTQLVGTGLTPTGIGFAALQANIAPIMGLLKTLGEVLIGSILPQLTSLGQAVVPPILGLINGIVPPLTEIIGIIVNLAGALISNIMPPLTQIIGSVLPPLTTVISALMPLLADVVKAIAPVIQVIGLVIGLILNILQPAIKFVADYIAVVVKTVSGVLDGLFKLVSGLITGDWRQAWQGAKQIFGSIWDGITGILKAQWEFIKGFFTAQLENIKTVWSGAWNLVSTYFSNVWKSIQAVLAGAWGAIQNAVNGGITNTVNTVKSLPGKAVAALGNIGQSLFNAGKHLVQGFINGIKSMFGAIGSTARDLGTKAMSGVKNILGIRSPSKVFTDIGIMTGRGMVNGVESMQGKVQDALKDMVNPANLKTLKVPLKPPDVNATLQVAGYTTPKTAPATTINITINGAVDPDSTARQIKRLLSQYDAKLQGATIG